VAILPSPFKNLVTLLYKVLSNFVLLCVFYLRNMKRAGRMLFNSRGDLTSASVS